MIRYSEPNPILSQVRPEFEEKEAGVYKTVIKAKLCLEMCCISQDVHIFLIQVRSRLQIRGLVSTCKEDIGEKEKKRNETPLDGLADCGGLARRLLRTPTPVGAGARAETSWAI
jgi:hypothetical protein